MTRKRTEPAVTPQQIGGRIGVQRRNAAYSHEELGNFGRKGFNTLINRKLQELLPDGMRVEDLTPKEYARRFEAAKSAHMQSIHAKTRLTNRERASNALLAATAIVVFTACPECNAERGQVIPAGIPEALCVHHWVTAHISAFGEVLDETTERQQRIAV